MQKNNTVEESSREKFNALSAEERQILRAKLLYAVEHDDTAVMYAFAIVEGAETKGVYDDWNYAGDAEVIGDVTLS